MNSREFSIADVRFITDTPETIMYAHSRHGLIKPRIEPYGRRYYHWFSLEEVVRLQLVEQLRRIGVRPAHHADVIDLCVLGALGRHAALLDDEKDRVLCPAFRFLVVSQSGPVYFDGSEALNDIKPGIAAAPAWLGTGPAEDVMIMIDLDAMLGRIAAKIEELDRMKAEGRTPEKSNR